MRALTGERGDFGFLHFALVVTYEEYGYTRLTSFSVSSSRSARTFTATLAFSIASRSSVFTPASCSSASSRCTAASDSRFASPFNPSASPSSRSTASVNSEIVVACLRYISGRSVGLNGLPLPERRMSAPVTDGRRNPVDVEIRRAWSDAVRE